MPTGVCSQRSEHCSGDHGRVSLWPSLARNTMRYSYPVAWYELPLVKATNALAHPAYDYVLVRQGWAILYFGILVSLASGQGHELEPALGAGPPTACTIFLVARSASLTSTMQHFVSYVDASVLALWRDIPKQSCAVPQVRRGLGSAQKAVWDCCVYFTPSFSLRHRIA